MLQYADDSKTHPTQPNYKMAAGNQPAPHLPGECKTFHIGKANFYLRLLLLLLFDNFDLSCLLPFKVTL